LTRIAATNKPDGKSRVRGRRARRSCDR
jgi:hypothetical protein